MHSFEVNIRICQPENSDVHRGKAEVNIPIEGWLILNIRICQPENSDVHRGKAEVNIPIEGWLILMLTEKDCTNCFVIWHCLSFPS